MATANRLDPVLQPGSAQEASRGTMELFAPKNVHPDFSIECSIVTNLRLTR